jgi:hypothetical protein
MKSLLELKNIKAIIQIRSFTTNKSNVTLRQLGSTFNQQPPWTSPTHKQKKFKLSFDYLTKYIPFVSNSSSSTSAFDNILKFNSKSKDGLFGLSELTNYDGLLLLRQKAEKRVNELIKEAFDDKNRLKTKRKLVEIFDDISNELCCVADLAEFIRTSHPDSNYRDAANQTFSAISQIVESLNTNYELYAKLKSSLQEKSNQDWLNMDECDRRVCNLFLIDFELSGIHLDQSKRNSFVKINDKLVDVLMKFQINSQAPSYIKASDVDPKFNSM